MRGRKWRILSDRKAAVVGDTSLSSGRTCNNQKTIVVHCWWAATDVGSIPCRVFIYCPPALQLSLLQGQVNWRCVEECRYRNGCFVRSGMPPLMNFLMPHPILFYRDVISVLYTVNSLNDSRPGHGMRQTLLIIYICVCVGVYVCMYVCVYTLLKENSRY